MKPKFKVDDVLITLEGRRCAVEALNEDTYRVGWFSSDGYVSWRTSHFMATVEGLTNLDIKYTLNLRYKKQLAELLNE